MSIDVTALLVIQRSLATPAGRILSIVCAEWLIYVFLPIIFFLGWRFPRRAGRDFILRAISSGALALTASLTLAQFIARPRPFRAYAGVLRLVPAPDAAFSFPSSHTSVAFALAMVLARALPEYRASCFGLALCIGLGRVAVGVHYPSDILAGMFLGLAVAVATDCVWKKHWWRFRRP